MATSALREAERFLYLHPHATTDVDNPVELLREVVAEAEDIEELADELENARRAMVEDAHELEEARGMKKKFDHLVAFVKKLHEQQKICDLELRAALSP
jgi:SMC interacting uncharacterized protein involved in chromosome segregation